MKSLASALVTRVALAVAAAVMVLAAGSAARAAAPLKPEPIKAEPIKIGFSIELTGGLANTGKSVLLTTQIWADQVNAKGGLLGRPVKLVYYDDQSNSAAVPGIATKLIDVDKVDIVLSGYSTAAVAPALPVVMQHHMLLIGLLGLNVNEEFHYDRYFSISSGGPEPRLEYSKGFFAAAMSMTPKPKTVAIASSDLEYAHIAAGGARVNAKRLGLQIVYDRTYPPTTTDFMPIMQAIEAAHPDIVYVASYPPDSAGMVRAASETGLKTRIFGGGMVGVQYASLLQQLGPLLNGVTVFAQYAPEATMQNPGIVDFLAEYQKRAVAAGVDALGYFGPPYAYARMQVLQNAIATTKSLDQKVLADYLHKAHIPTILGDMTFGADGERPKPLAIFVQYRGITGHGLAQFKKPGRQVIIYPPALKSGDFQYPFTATAQ